MLASDVEMIVLCDALCYMYTLSLQSLWDGPYKESKKRQSKLMKKAQKLALPISFFFDLGNWSFWCYKNSSDFFGNCC